MDFLTLLIVSMAVLALCVLAMAVGVMIRNRGFSSCGCASITYRGQKIRCPGCTEKDEDA